jgi:hypothetical protein
VQNQCTYVDSSNNAVYQNVYVPLTGKTVTLAQAIYQDKQLSKGNVLQYKKNSSNLTKKQKYTQICKGMWTNRTKSYSTQTQTYTNPNTSNLLQVNYNVVPSSSTTYINGPYKYNIPSPYGCVSTIIKDGGSLLCNTVANPCTNEVIETTTILKCYPTSCSDVPGPEQLLCWDERLNTWYPRQRYIMPTSGTGWPEGYKGFVSAEKPPTPVLTLDSSTECSVTLSWTVSNDACIPISSYNIYINGQIYTNVPYTTTTITINNLSNGNNSFYVTSISNTTESDKSNTVNVTINQVPPIITSITTCYKQATISWTDTTPNIIEYNIYLDGILYTTVPYTTTTITISDLINGQTYSFAVSAVSNCGTLQSETSTIPMPPTSTYFTIVGGSGLVSGSNYIITFTTSGTLTYNTVCNIDVTASLLLVGGGGGGAGGGGNSNGGGGGGGGSVLSQTILFQNGDVSNITAIGNGGTGGNWLNSGGNGGNTLVDFFTATGATGGNSNGVGGTGGGGNGGNGATASETDGLIGGAGISGYSGGGGGGSYPNSSSLGSGGGCGVNGIGGVGGIATSSSFPNGVNAATYGSGGGGGVGAFKKGNGGNGYQGVAIFTIPN